MDITRLRKRVRRHYRGLVGVLVFLSLVYVLYPHITSNHGLKSVKSSFDWASLPPHHPPSEPLHVLPIGDPKPLPKIQHDFYRHPRRNATIEARRNAVKAVFLKCWRSYEKYAWMRDELTPLTAGGKDTFGGWAATLVDNLDTLWIMDLKDDFLRAAKAVARIDWEKTPETAANMFETTIRYLGGLLSAYDLSGQTALLEKAVELGDMLYVGFDTPNRMPPFWLDFEKAKTGKLTSDFHQAAASAATLSLEFTRLAQLTGDNKYYDAIARVTDALYTYQNSTKVPGLWPVFFDLQHNDLISDRAFSLGALSDSMYEYVLKMHPLLGGLESKYESMYRTMTPPIQERLLFRPMTPKNLDILIAGDLRVDSESTYFSTESQHLSCFAGGMFALGAKIFSLPEHLSTAAQLTNGCIWAYSSTPSGIMPEIYNLVSCPTHNGCAWNETAWKLAVENESIGARQANLPKGFRNVRDPEYLLRPEALESVFYMYRISGLEEYREAAWTMFRAIDAATSTRYGNAAIDNVLSTEKPTQRDSMESFWQAETLKYLYLIFSPPDLISLDEFVFNTEAHPLRLPR